MRRSALAAALALGAVAAAPAGAAERSDLLIHQLLGLDQRKLFGNDYTPLAEMEAWGDVYASLRDEAKADRSADLAAVKTFMLTGWIAMRREDFGTIGGFKTDFKALFDARPGDVLDAMASNAFMIPDMCTTLAAFFFFEDAKPEDRQPFIESHKAAMEQRLGAEGSARCLEAFQAVTE